MLALRTTDGLDLDRFRARFGGDPSADRNEAVARAAAAGLLVVDGSRLRPTAAGLAVADTLAAELA